IGVDYQRINSDQTFRSVSDFGEFISPELTNDLANLTNTSGYFTAIYVHKLIGVELGGRINENSNYGVNYSYSVNPYFKTAGFKVYGVMAKAYKNPSLYQVFSEYGNRDLKPQEAFTFDVGIEYENKNAVKVAAVLFNRRTENLFFFNSTNVAPFGEYINLDSQSESGIELEVNKKWSNVQLYGNVTRILSAKTIVDASATESPNLSFLRRPRAVINAGLTVNPVSKLTLNGNIQYQSKRTDRFYNSAIFASETVDLNAFKLVNLTSSYEIINNLKVGLTVNNLLNQQYFEVYGYNSQPRNFAINASFRL
ncbi:MAG: TonB-dependent receptor, partial [Spirosomaceae bacterium]|nr:TonB-dependent receptor [Spirosomataceae bacterium]